MGRPAELPSRSRLHGAADLHLGGDDWQAGNPPRVPALVDLLPLQRLPHLDLAGGSEDHNTEAASSQAVSSFLLPIRSRRRARRTLWEGERHAKAIAFWYLPFFMDISPDLPKITSTTRSYLLPWGRGGKT